MIRHRKRPEDLARPRSYRLPQRFHDLADELARIEPGGPVKASTLLRRLLEAHARQALERGHALQTPGEWEEPLPPAPG